jgi:hypothetical protein
VQVEIVCPANGTPGMIIMVMVDMNEIRAVLRCQSRIQQPRKAAARDRNARGMGSSVKQGCSAPRKKRTEEDVDVISINSSDNESSWDGSLEGMPPQGDLFDEIPPLPMKGDVSRPLASLARSLMQSRIFPRNILCAGAHWAQKNRFV